MSIYDTMDIAEWEDRQKIRIVEQSTAEREQETRELFEKIRPLLDNGCTYNKALRHVRGLRSLNTKNGWYKDVIAYGERMGYPKEEYSYKRRPKQ